MTREREKFKGRGANSNLTGRFESGKVELLTDEDIGGELLDLNEPKSLPRTQFLRDSSRSIVTENKSPDIGFRYSINAYRGCEHGCAYCYARPTHEYLGMSAGLDFESKIFVKYDAAELLRERLMKPSWQGEPIFMSGITDCYQPAERKFQLTRACLEVLKEFKNPVGIITKNHLVTRDIDLLKPLAEIDAALVMVSITSLDDKLCADLEPRTSRPQMRLDAVRQLADAGVYVGINVAPLIPGLNDHELPAILHAAKQAGAKFAGYTPIRLPLSVAPLFSDWLEMNRPERKEKVLGLVRQMRGGELNNSEFGSRMRGEGPIADNLNRMFKVYAKREGLTDKDFALSSAHFSRPGDQLTFF